MWRLSSHALGGHATAEHSAEGTPQERRGGAPWAPCSMILEDDRIGFTLHLPTRPLERL